MTRPVFIDLDDTVQRGIYLLFKFDTTFALIGRDTSNAHHDLFTLFKILVERAGTPELQPFNPVSDKQICGAGLYKIDPTRRTITFLGKSEKYKHIPLGPLETLQDEITQRLGLLVRIYPKDDWYKYF